MAPDPRIDTVLGGCRIEAVLARGGMGIVYQGEQIALGRRAAVKVIAPEHTSDDSFRQRFQQESRLAASIDHPHVIPIYEAGEAGDVLYIVMRYVGGSDLRTVIQANGALPASRAVDLIGQVADALDAAHAGGLVHRDVKPANVLLEQRDGHEHAFLSDFGLSKLAASTSGVTRSGEWLGTLDYAAPEQIQGQRLDARTDVYALGCLLFQCLTGSVPFPRDSLPAKINAHLQESPPSVAGTEASTTFDWLIARALAKDPAERFPSGGDLGRAAQAAAEGEAPTEPERTVATGAAAPSGLTAAVHVQPRHAPPHPTRPPVPSRGQAVKHEAAPRRASRHIALGVLGLVLVALGVAGTLFLIGLRDDELSTAAPSPRAEPVGADESPVRESGPAGPTSESFVPYRAASYSAEYPSGWTIERDDELVSTYREAKFVSPDGGSFVKINQSSGEQTDPATKATEVEAEVSDSTEGYERLSFEPTTLRDSPGFQWTFEQGGAPPERRVDYFLNVGGDGFAVLGGGTDFGRVLPVARRVAESIEPGVEASGDWPSGVDAHTVILASEPSRSAAEAKGQEASDLGEPAGVLRSGDYASLRPGYWVAFSGQYSSAEDAKRAAERLRSLGLGDAYARFISAAG